MSIEKLGIYGGTFAPLHNAHVRMATEFKKQMKLDKLLIIPASVPPHKKLSFNDSPVQRLEMLKLVFDTPEYKNLGIEVSDFELTRPGKSYTVETLKHFTKEGREIFLLCGTDMLLSFHQWKDVETIAKLCTLTFAQRETDDRETNEKIAAQIDFLQKEYSLKIKRLDLPAMVLSSTYVREHIDEDISHLVPEAVLNYIRANKLYGR